MDIKYELLNFQYTPASGGIVIATVTREIDGLIWTMNKRISGEASKVLWGKRGKSEEDLIKLILAAP